MRFMMLMIPGVYQGSRGREVGADFTPDAEAVERMTRYNEDLAKAGALITLDGLHPPSTGARVSFRNGKPTVTRDPFTESGGILGGYWMINARSLAEAIEWAKRVPAEEDDTIEVRQVFDMSDFPEDVQKAAANSAVLEAVGQHK
jgi:hypothetical protein